jgi:hypothetical protein
VLNYAQVQREAAKFGGKIVATKVYDFPPGARNISSGQQVQAQMPNGHRRRA